MGLFKKTAEFVGKGLKTISGVQAYRDRKEAKSLKEEADNLLAEIEAENEWQREETNTVLEQFGNVRLKALQETVKPFLDYLKYMKVGNKEKEYEIFRSIDIKPEEVATLERISMNASQAMKTTVLAGSVASVALAGVPTAVTTAVSAYAAASTGTAIATLHGAAATNAMLAWLGGGSLAAGGGGIAAGTAVLTGITYATAGVFALAAAGIVGSMHYSKKLTEATEYLSKVEEYKAKMEVGWAVLDGIRQRAKELEDLTNELKYRIQEKLQLLEPLVYDFMPDDKYYMKTFQTNAILVKSMSELAQVPLLNEKGEVSDDSSIVANDVKTIMNTNL